MFIDHRSTLRDPTTPTPPGKFFEPETWYLDIYKCCVVEKYIVVVHACDFQYARDNCLRTQTNTGIKVYVYNGTNIKE